MDILRTIGGLVLVDNACVLPMFPGGVVKLLDALKMEVVGEVNKEGVLLGGVGFDSVANESS